MDQIDRTDRGKLKPVLLAASLFFVLAHGRAEAQVFVGVSPYGPFFGWADTQAAELSNYVYRHSLDHASAAEAQRDQAMNVVENPNAHYNRLREPEYTGRYDAVSRRPVEVEAVRAPYPAPRKPSTAVANPEPAASRARPLAEYFDRSDVLVWPDDAPTEGELRAKRAVSNRASLAVLNEVRQQRAARVSTVAEARTKLLDYGRPALELLRKRTTPAISELFHAFLLGLYDSLEQAATPRPDARR